MTLSVAGMRFFHVLAALYNIAYVYTPLNNWAHGFAVVQWVSMPALLLTGAMLVHTRKQAMTKA